MLLDRVDEADALDRVLVAVRDGLSEVLVLRGQPGIGKTALLEWAVERADDMWVSQVAGVESEMDLGYAGLHQVLIPFLAGLDRLPEPQRRALGAAFGMEAGPAPNRFLVGLATLTLLTEAAARRPVLCVIDDAQWLDRVSTEVLGFVARRLLADQVGIVFAVREGEQFSAALDGLAELTVGALPAQAAVELLTAAAGQPVDQRVGERIAAETAGNPLALVEYGSELTAAQASGAAPLAAPLRFSGRLDELYRSRIRALPEQAQLLLVLAAADQLGWPAKVWEAAGTLGIDPDVATLPAMDRLISWEPRVQFRHPLMRSAAYYAASASARRQAHEALAAASDPKRDPDRRAWHLGAAAPGPDEQVAAELERSADRARSRGGWASGAAFLERAAELTPDATIRSRRLLEAAEARFVAGEASAVRALLNRAVPDLGDPLARAKARRLEGLSRYAAGEPAATDVLLDAARMIEPYDAPLARDTLLEAFVAAYFSGPGGADRVLRAVHPAAAGSTTEETLADLLLNGFAAAAENKHETAVELLRRAIAPLAAEEPLPDDVLQRFLPMSMAASLLYDDSAWHELERRWVAELRGRGALSVLLPALVSVSYNQLYAGRFADAEATIAEGQALSEATSFPAHLALFACAQLAVLASRGREAETRELAARLLGEFTATGHGLGANQVRQALTTLEVGLGNYEEALRVALGGDRGFVGGPVVEIIEAAIRCGDRDTATAVLQGFAPLAATAGTHPALGYLALGQAMLAGDEAEAQYQLAIEHLRQCRHVPLLARSYLLYGEWLRRQRRRQDAREQLRAAWETFTRLGMAAFADRAHAELRATGEHARKRTADARDELTPQEAQIARLAADGASNGEIAAKLFISASTVEYHLRKVFRKLGITTRVRLPQALGSWDGGGGRSAGLGRGGA